MIKISKSLVSLFFKIIINNILILIFNYNFNKVNLNEASRKKLIEYKERLKNLNTEAKSMKTMLEKSSNSWQKFNEGYSILNSWFENHKNISDISNVFFFK